MIEFANDVTPIKSKLKFPFSTLGWHHFGTVIVFAPLWSTIRRTLNGLNFQYFLTEEVLKLSMGVRVHFVTLF